MGGYNLEIFFEKGNGPKLIAVLYPFESVPPPLAGGSVLPSKEVIYFDDQGAGPAGSAPAPRARQVQYRAKEVLGAVGVGEGWKKARPRFCFSGDLCFWALL